MRSLGLAERSAESVRAMIYPHRIRPTRKHTRKGYRTATASLRSNKNSNDCFSGVFGLSGKPSKRLGGDIGGPCWTRTSDQVVKSHLLYQLS